MLNLLAILLGLVAFGGGVYFGGISGYVNRASRSNLIAGLMFGIQRFRPADGYSFICFQLFSWLSIYTAFLYFFKIVQYPSNKIWFGVFSVVLSVAGVFLSRSIGKEFSEIDQKCFEEWAKACEDRRKQ